MKRCWLLLLLPHLAWAARLDVAWEFPRTYSPAPDRFIIVLETPEGTDHYAVPPSAPGGCTAFGTDHPDLYCATLPHCPPEGVYHASVYAERGLKRGPASEPVRCVFTDQMPCRCLAVQTTLPSSPPPPVASPPVTLPPPPLETGRAARPSATDHSMLPTFPPLAPSRPQT